MCACYFRFCHRNCVELFSVVRIFDCRLRGIQEHHEFIKYEGKTYSIKLAASVCMCLAASGVRWNHSIFTMFTYWREIGIFFCRFNKLSTCSSMLPWSTSCWICCYPPKIVSNKYLHYGNSTNAWFDEFVLCSAAAASSKAREKASKAFSTSIWNVLFCSAKSHWHRYVAKSTFHLLNRVTPFLSLFYFPQSVGLLWIKIRIFNVDEKENVWRKQIESILFVSSSINNFRRGKKNAVRVRPLAVMYLCW